MEKRTQHVSHYSGPAERACTLDNIANADAFFCIAYFKDPNAPHGFRVNSMRHGTPEERADALFNGVLLARNKEPLAFERIKAFFKRLDSEATE